MQSTRAGGSKVSIVPMSLENLLRILPDALLLKNHMVARIIPLKLIYNTINNIDNA